MNDFLKAGRVGFFLAQAQIKRAGKLTTVLTVSVMIFTFLAQIFISGILIGLIEGSSVEFRKSYLGDLFITPLEKKVTVERTYDITQTLRNNPRVHSLSSRFKSGGKIEANYQTRSSDEAVDSIGVQAVGIIPEDEDETTHIARNIVEGEMITSEDSEQYITISSNLLDRYSNVSDVLSLLQNVRPGTRVKITIGNRSEEFIVKGIFKIKAGALAQTVFMKQEALQRLTGDTTSDSAEIAVRMKVQGDEKIVQEDLKREGFDAYAKIQTYEESEPEFVKNMKTLFSSLGSMFGSITLVVAAITVFIIIFINALTRRKYIGILKGIGIDGRAIEIAYVLQSVFYALIGVAIGSLITFLVLKPLFVAHPIDFPFSDGILVATVSGTVWRGVILITISLIAAYLPARMIIRQNTLDSILGRPSKSKENK